MKVLLVRPDRNEADARALRDVGLDPWVDPYLVVAAVSDPRGAADLLAALSGPADWLVVTSPRAMPAWAELVGRPALVVALAEAVDRGLRLAAVGPGTAAAVTAMLDRTTSPAPVLVPARSTAVDLVAALVEASPSPALAAVPAGDLARPELAAGLRAAGWEVLDRVVYTTRPVPSPVSAGALARGEVAAVILRSPSAVRAVLTHPVAPGTVLVAVGPTTAAALAATGRPHRAVDGDPSAVAAALATALAR